MSILSIEQEKALRDICDDDRFIKDIIKLSVGLKFSSERKRADPTPSKIKHEMSALYENIRRLSPAAKEHIHAYIINEYIQFKYRGGDINISHVERMGNIAFDSFIAACRDHENFKKTSARDDFVAQLSFESEVFRRVYGLKITSYEEGDFVTIIDIILKTANCDFNPARIAKDALNYHKKELISA